MPGKFIAYILIEFGPLLVFFFVSAIYGFYPAAAALILTTIIALLSSLYWMKRFAYFSFFVSIFTIVSGFATLMFRQPLWLVLEFTISNLIIAGILLRGLKKDRLYLKSMFNHMFLITDRAWRIISLRWSAVFFLVGSSNQIFWHLYPQEDLWTLFRFITTLLTVAFALTQFSLSKRERLPEANEWGMRK